MFLVGAGFVGFLVMINLILEWGFITFVVVSITVICFMVALLYGFAGFLYVTIPDMARVAHYELDWDNWRQVMTVCVGWFVLAAIGIWVMESWENWKYAFLDWLDSRKK